MEVMSSSELLAIATKKLATSDALDPETPFSVELKLKKCKIFVVILYF